MSDSMPTIVLPTSFRFDQVRPTRPLEPKLVIPTPTPPLGILSNFHGEFAGRGFNMIFRPNSGPPNGTTFTNPIPAPPIPTPPNENVLELNLTTETLSFSNALGNVPNRGLETQKDIFLNGVPYVQAINDVTNPATGKADGPPTGIHFEPGLWMHIPATETVPVLAEFAGSNGVYSARNDNQCPGTGSRRIDQGAPDHPVGWHHAVCHRKPYHDNQICQSDGRQH